MNRRIAELWGALVITACLAIIVPLVLISLLGGWPRPEPEKEE